MVDKFVWDRYDRIARLSVTTAFCLLAFITVVAGGGAWASISILGAAIAFHTEYSLTIDAAKHQFELRRIVKPFAEPLWGSIDGIKEIRLDVSQSNAGPVYSASIVFRDNVAPFKIVRGEMDYVLYTVSGLRSATKLELAESDNFKLLRERFTAATSLLNTKP